MRLAGDDPLDLRPRAEISIAETRAIASGLLEGHPTQRALLSLVDAAELLRDRHEVECGCDDPGSETACAWPLDEGRLLGSFDFDEASA